MSREYYTYFIKTWLPQYKKQYKEAENKKKYNEIKTLKENLYGNANLLEKQKDYIWNLITRVKE